MEKILVPVDFSDFSEYALEVAASIAKPKKSEIMVLHMMGLSEAVLTKDEAQEFFEAKYYMKLAKKRFSSFLDKPYLQGLKVTEMVQNYKIFSEINQVSKEHGVSLIVMGSHGVSAGVKDIFVGSNTEKVVRTSEIPVLVVKKRRPDFEIKRIAMAWHYKDESLSTYRKAKDFANWFGAELKLVYINLPGFNFLSSEQIEEKTTRFMENTGIGEEVAVYCDYSVENGLLNYGEKIDADVLAIATHGRRGLYHFLVGSIGEDLANHSDLPVVTFRI